MKERFTIRRVTKKESYELLKILFQKYEDDLGFRLQFQDFSKELASLSSMYGNPGGAAFLLFNGKMAVGCIAVRELDPGIAEIKRMFIEIPWRGKGYGKTLLDAALDAARELGYKKVRLDTLDYMQPAIKSYKRAGFYEIPAYRHNPFDNAVFMEKAL